MRLAVLLALAAAIASGGDLSDTDRALFFAARSGDTASTGRLLRAGARVAARDARGRTPLHEAAASGRPDTVRALVAAGADVDARERSGWTPLMEAAKHGRVAAALALLLAGANPDARDRAAGTVKDIAQREGQPDLMALLLRHGAKGGGKSVGDRVCVRPWKGAGFCGRVEAIQGTRYLIDVTRVEGCVRGCAPDEDCSSGRSVGGGSPDAVVGGVSVWTAGWCLTHTGLE